MMLMINGEEKIKESQDLCKMEVKTENFLALSSSLLFIGEPAFRQVYTHY